MYNNDAKLFIFQLPTVSIKSYDKQNKILNTLTDVGISFYKVSIFKFLSMIFREQGVL